MFDLCNVGTVLIVGSFNVVRTSMQNQPINPNPGGFPHMQHWDPPGITIVGVFLT